MSVHKVPIGEIPDDPFVFAVEAFARRLMEQTASTQGYYQRFDWTKNPKQLFLRDLLRHPPSNRIQHVLLRGSIGSGKSLSAHAWAFETLDRYPGASWLGLRKTHDEIITSIWQQIKKFLDRHEVRYTDGKQPAYIELPNKSSWRFWSEGAVLDPHGDTAKGLGSTEFSGATLEEADTLSELTASTVEERLREPSGVPTRVIFYPINPPSKEHWLYKRFVLKEVNNPEDYHEIHMTLEDNRYWLEMPGVGPGAGWIEAQYSSKKNQPLLFKKQILGEWGPVVRGKPIFGEMFNRAFHVVRGPSLLSRWSDDKLYRDGPMCLCWDFGTTHPCCVVFQDVDYGRFQQIRILACWVGSDQLLRFFAQHVLDRIGELFPHGEPYECYGDPAGESRDNRGVTEENAFDVLRALGLSPKGKKSSIEYGINLIAELLTTTHPLSTRGVQPLLIIDDNPYTQDLIDGFEVGYCQNPDTNRDVWDPVKDGFFDHIHDSLRYGLIYRRRPGTVAQSIVKPVSGNLRPGYSPRLRVESDGSYTDITPADLVMLAMGGGRDGQDLDVPFYNLGGYSRR